MSNRRNEVQNEYMRALTEAVKPFFEGQAFDQTTPGDLSNVAFEALIVANSIRQFKDMLAAKACELENVEGADTQFHDTARAAAYIHSFLEAIKLGQTHPLLDYWTYVRSHNENGSRRDRRLLDFQRRQAAMVVMALEHTAKIPTAKKRRELVAKLLVESGAFATCRETAVKHWMYDLRPSDLTRSRDMARECQYDPQQILGAFRNFLELHSVDLSGGRKSREDERLSGD